MPILGRNLQGTGKTLINTESVCSLDSDHSEHLQNLRSDSGQKSLVRRAGRGLQTAAVAFNSEELTPGPQSGKIKVLSLTRKEGLPHEESCFLDLNPKYLARDIL